MGMNSTSDIGTTKITPCSRVLGDRLIISGRLLRIAQPHAETFDPLEDPELFLSSLRENEVTADLFTFAQRVTEPIPQFSYFRHHESEAVLPIETYEKWWKQTVNDKTRNMVRKAGKKGVVIEVAEYTDDLVLGIKEVYDECPVRQGKKSRHYGKSFEQIKTEHGTFLDRSEFIAARFQDRLIGFAKVVFARDFASIMNLIALVGERDKAPTNALLAKAVERCASRGINLLHYGVWSRRGFGDFKLHHGFVCREIPRYYIPLSTKGALALQLGLHRPVTGRLPAGWIDWLAGIRTKWYSWRYRMT
jgi:hypothetical protein